ncbi:hypothetical protein L596_029941 [Steinernema carpocapsae]|uniref:Uncharacterized protein n=1 Tax=Steinernema carpocapsae TaxID=34508 RepID=A0A4U5LR90_STECR|nr:hypothetical protein L596_029941 [Steinernema carpocapsae]
MPAVGWSGRFISASGDSSERSERLCFFYEYEINSVVLANEQLRPRSCPGDPFLPPHSLNPRLGSVLYVAGSLPIANPAALFSVCVPHAQNAQLLLERVSLVSMESVCEDNMPPHSLPSAGLAACEWEALSPRGRCCVFSLDFDLFQTRKWTL